MSEDYFAHPTYRVRRKVLKLFGGAFHVFDPSGDVVLFANMKAFKLKEDIRLYTGEDMTEEVLRIHARKIIDFSSAYDVIDARSGEKVGALKRRGWKSMLRDEWVIMDVEDRDIGTIREDSAIMALVRRFLSNLFPQKFHCEIGDTLVCTFKQNFNPFVLKLTVDFTFDPDGLLDRRLGLAAAVLLSAIEGRQG